MRTSAHTGVAIPSILLGLPMVDTARFRGLHHRHSLRSPHQCAHWFAMTCSLFVPALLFVIHPSAAEGGDSVWLRQNLPIEVKFCRRNAGDGVPYGDLCRDTPPGVSGPMRPRVGDTRGRVSLQGDSIKTRRGDPCGRPGTHHKWRGAAASRPVGIVFRSIGAFVQARYFAGGA